MTYTPFTLTGENRPGKWLVICDHATNTVPDAVNGGTLGLPEEDMARHIAWDPGAAGVSRALAAALDCPCLCSNFSRLVIDPNRGAQDPTLLMKLYDGTIIPGNRHAGTDALMHRKTLCYQPYHRAVARHAARLGIRIVSVHSFTPALRGRAPRPWEVGILFDPRDRRLADPLIAELQAQGGAPVGVNEPYKGHLPGDTIDTHCIAHGRPNVLIELRQDVIATEADQQAWGTRLAPLLEAAAQQAQV